MLICYIKNKINNKMYIMSVEEKRYARTMASLYWELRNGLYVNKILQEDFIKYGEYQFERGKIFIIRREDIRRIKQIIIERYNSICPNGYNIHNSIRKELDREKKRLFDKKYYKENREKFLERRKIFRERNKNYNKEYRIKNKEKIKELQKEWYIKNKERIKPLKKEWYLNNRERILQKRKKNEGAI